MQALDKILSQLKLATAVAAEAERITEHLDGFEDKNSIREMVNSMIDSTLVLLTGHFEGFVKGVILEFLAELEKLKVDSNSYPEEMICQLIVRYGERIKKEDLSAFQELKAVMIDGAAAKLYGDLFAKTAGNPSVDVIEGNFAKIGIANVLDVLTIEDYKVETTYVLESVLDKNLSGKIHDVFSCEWSDVLHDKLQPVIDAKWNPKKKRRDIGYINVVQSLLERRNKLAHGEDVVKMTVDELRQVISSVEKLVIGLERKVVEKINSVST